MLSLSVSSHICTYLNYKWNTTVATLKYISIEQVSTIVVISGDAIIAGSKCSFFASSGRIQPISFAKITVITSEIEMTTASEKFLYISRILSPFASARITPTIIEIRNSLIFAQPFLYLALCFRRPSFSITGHISCIRLCLKPT
jgi:hypothetical protein